MKQAVIVNNVQDDNTILVYYPNPKSEKSNSSRSFWGVKERTFPALNLEHFDLHEKDMVEILIDRNGAISAAFMMFIFPLLCFLAVYLIVGQFTDTEWILFLFGVLGLTSGIFANGLIKKIKGIGKIPTIIRVLSRAEILEWTTCNSACKECKGCG